MTSPLRAAFAGAGAELAVVDGVECALRVAGVEAEYHSVRQHVGLGDMPDVAHIRVAGEAARELLDGVVAGNVQNLPERAIRTTVAFDEAGRMIGDVTVHCLFDEYILGAGVTTHAALLARLRAAAPGGVSVEDLSHTHAMFRADGPDAADLPRALLGLEAAGLRLMSFATCRLDGAEVMVGRVGSTGEFGYQFLAERAALPAIFARVRELAPGARLCGREAYDLLHLEMRSFNRRLDMPHDEPALAAGLHWMIDFRKPAFVGREALFAAKAAGLARRMVCVQLEAGTPAPETDAAVRLDGREVGYVAHAAVSFTLGAPVALAYLDTACAVVGLPVTVDGAAGAARTVSAPFVKTRSNTGRAG